MVRNGGRAMIVDRASVSPSQIIVHNAHAEDASQSFALSRLEHGLYGPTRLGVFRDVYRPVYDDMLKDEVAGRKLTNHPPTKHDYPLPLITRCRLSRCAYRC